MQMSGCVTLKAMCGVDLHPEAYFLSVAEQTVELQVVCRLVGRQMALLIQTLLKPHQFV